jgi:transposase
MAPIQDANAFASGREFAAFLGLTPRQNSTGGKTRLERKTVKRSRGLRLDRGRAPRQLDDAAKQTKETSPWSNLCTCTRAL